MRQRSPFVLTGIFLLLCLHVAEPGLGPGVIKPGFCPEFPIRCPFTMISSCLRDQSCRKDKKCCYYECRYKCMEPWPSLD